MVEISDDFFARRAWMLGPKGYVARRNVEHLARVLGKIFEHEAAINLHVEP
jgi:hypothetical protein